MRGQLSFRIGGLLRVFFVQLTKAEGIGSTSERMPLGSFIPYRAIRQEDL